MQKTALKNNMVRAGLVAVGALVWGGVAWADCSLMGPQAPRDINKAHGENKRTFSPAPDYQKMNLCNMHTHFHAEHKGPGFLTYVGPGDYGGYACNDAKSVKAKAGSAKGAAKMSKAKLRDLEPGDTIEMHWVFTSCSVAGPAGNGLNNCVNTHCTNPQLRVEAQVFLLVDDPKALDMKQFAAMQKKGHWQPKSLPDGIPVTFQGSTTGTSYDGDKCSPLQVTWSVRPQCARLNIHSYRAWIKSNPYQERKAHGVRALVVNPALLSKMK